MARDSDFKVAKLEYHVQLIQDDWNLLDVMTKPDNQTQQILDEAEDLISRINHTLTSEAFESTTNNVSNHDF